MKEIKEILTTILKDLAKIIETQAFICKELKELREETKKLIDLVFNQNNLN